MSVGDRIRQELLGYFMTAMPPNAYILLATTLDEVTRGSGGGKLSLAILMTLAASSSGMVAIIEGLNTAYSVREARKWWMRRIVAVGLTLALALFSITALAIMLYGAQFGDFLAQQIGLKPVFQAAWRLAQWPLMSGFVLLAFAIVYRFAPNVHEQKLHWIVPGSVVALVVWFLASLGLRLYLRVYDSYSTTYGSLGALIVLMIWFYLFAAILIGGEVNSIIETSRRRCRRSGSQTAGRKSPQASPRPDRESDRRGRAAGRQRIPKSAIRCACVSAYIQDPIGVRLPPRAEGRGCPSIPRVLVEVRRLAGFPTTGASDNSDSGSRFYILRR